MKLGYNDQNPFAAFVQFDTRNVLAGNTDALTSHPKTTLYLVNTAGVDAMTLANPTAGADDGQLLAVVSLTANAHTITASAGSMNGGAVGNTTATFAAHPGAAILLIAFGGKWYVLSSTGITIT